MALARAFLPSTTAAMTTTSAAVGTPPFAITTTLARSGGGRQPKPAPLVPQPLTASWEESTARAQAGGLIVTPAIFATLV